jgi:hypothetical protein
MEIDKQKLISLLEAFLQTAQVFERELMLYQIMFQTACKTQHLTDQEIEHLVNQARKASADRIRAATESGLKDLLGKLPQIVDLLNSDRDAALRLLREWKPKGPPN